MRYFQIVVLWLLAAVALGDLYVYYPRKLRNEIDPDHGKIPSSLANFGQVHYGHNIVGRVWYDDDNKNGWNPFEIEFTGLGDPDAEPSPIVMVNRGGCPFTKKVRNIQHAGGTVAIVIDNKENEEMDDILMVDDGTGNGITIPAMMISHEHGLKILKYMVDGDEDEHTNNSTNVSLMAAFDIRHPDNRVEWDLWFSSNEEIALNFLKNYREFHEKLGNQTLFTPHYTFTDFPRSMQNKMEDDCLSKGKYCIISQKSNDKRAGRDVLYEDLRQICLFNKMSEKGTPERWWDYIIQAHTDCQTNLNEACSENTHNKLGLSFPETIEWVEESFKNKGRNSERNTLFDKELKYKNKYGPQFFPGAVVNNITYKGVLEPQNFFEAVCTGFKNRPDECKVKEVSTTIIEGISTSTLIFIIVALVVINTGIIVLYNRYIKKREMDRKIEMHINSAVSQYFALQDKSKGPPSKEERPLVV